MRAYNILFIHSASESAGVPNQTTAFVSGTKPFSTRRKVHRSEEYRLGSTTAEKCNCSLVLHAPIQHTRRLYLATSTRRKLQGKLLRYCFAYVTVYQESSLIWPFRLASTPFHKSTLTPVILSVDSRSTPTTVPTSVSSASPNARPWRYSVSPLSTIFCNSGSSASIKRLCRRLYFNYFCWRWSSLPFRSVSLLLATSMRDQSLAIFSMSHRLLQVSAARFTATHVESKVGWQTFNITLLSAYKCKFHYFDFEVKKEKKIFPNLEVMQFMYI